jgi:proteasome lid subunit RPN8/RPN11
MTEFVEHLPVYRTRPLPRGQLRGDFLVTDSVIGQTQRALTDFALAGIRDGGHEGLVFWAGLDQGSLTVYTTVVVPEAEHSASRVYVTEKAYGRAVAEARRAGVLLLAQVHSHPGGDTRHSDGDDELIILPFDGMLSIVVPNYGIGWSGLSTASVHQHQDGRWVLCTKESVQRGLTVAPLRVDAR